MTATLTRDFVYTDHFAARNSSVIDDVYYNSDSQRLVVRLLSGSAAGYERVPADVFNGFKNENDSWSGSVGSYWNSWIKPNFTGFSTGEIENYVSAEAAAEEEDVTFVGVSSDLSPWYVGYTVDGGEWDILVNATDLRDAVDRVEKMAVIANWNGLSVTSVTAG